MIGGFRVIGGDRGAYQRGYCAGLEQCKEANLDLERIKKEEQELMEELHRKEKGDTRLAARHSALFDVRRELQDFLILFGEEGKELAEEIVTERIDKVLETWET